MRRSFILILTIISVIAGCNTGKTNSNTCRKITEKGKVIDRVICRKDLNQNYSLYLPSGYDTSKKYPVIYFFDPHAKGKQVIYRYYSLAEKFGFIIAASNNSKNGLSLNETNEIFDNMLDDTKNKLSIDVRRIYTAGFSGGARVASSIAIFKGGIAGVIGCGAGFPQVSEPIGTYFNYLAIEGVDDFNFIEMNNLNEALNSTPIPHYLINFKGKHEWPDAEIFSDGFMWLIFNAAKDRFTVVDDNMVNEFISNNISKISSKKDNRPSDVVYDTYNKLVKFLDGIYDVSGFKNSLDSVYKSNSYKAFLKDKKEVNSLENYKMQEYIIAYQSRPLSWWRGEIRNLEKNITTGRNIQEKDLNKRLLNYLSMLSYVNIDHFIKAGDFSKINDYLTIYYLVDSLNSDYRYFLGCYYLKQNNQNEALKQLEQAVQLGFNDMDKVQQDGYFSSLENDPRYREIIRSVKD